MSYEDIRDALARWTAAGDAAAVATLVDVRRSAPREPGARFAVSAGGQLAGSVSSGCVEGDLHERLRAILGGGEAQLVSYGISDELAATVGLSCGGEIDVFLARHDPDDPAWTALGEAVEAGRPAVLAIGLSGKALARRLLLEPDREAGGLGDPAADAAARAAAERLMGRSGSEVVDVEGGVARLFMESIAPPPRLVIVGATPVAEALAAFAARDGFDVAVVDPRSAFARPDRFPAATVVEAWPDDALAELGADPFTSVVVLAHDAKLDEPALAAALAAGCAYVGLLGGRRTQESRRAALVERGLPPADVDRIHGPVGLDIGARSPTQIAVSILAELISEGRAP